MDAHFHEYLAAVAGMQEFYGHPTEEQPTEFHVDVAASGIVDPAAPLATSP